MSHLLPDTPNPADLRARASARLHRADDVGASSTSMVPALATLHALASNPQTAADALALLHELQVHQVELELQTQELQESRAELEATSRRQTDLYDAQPVACFTLDAHLVVQELNAAAVELLGLDRAQAYGVHLGQFLALSGQRDLAAWVAQALAGAPLVAGVVRLFRGDERGQDLKLHLRADVSTGLCFLVLTEAVVPTR